MSKRNRNRFRDTEHRQNQTHNSTVTTSVVSPSEKRASTDAMAQHAAEYKVISKDMIRLVALNGFMLAAVIVVFYTNRTSGYLERFFEQLF